MDEEARKHLPDDFTGLFIGIPCVSGDIRADTMTAFIKSAVLMTKLEIPFGFFILIGSSAVERARNSVVEEFLRKTEFSHMLMVDDDMDFPHTAPLKLLANKHDVCFAAGVKKKRPNIDDKPSFAIFPLGTANPVCKECGCVEMAAGGACFMLVSRYAINKMMSAFPDLWYCNDDEPTKCTPALFNPYIEERSHIYRAEDLAFFYRWRQIGGHVWLDTSIELGHWGATRWSGNINECFTFKEE